MNDLCQVLSNLILDIVNYKLKLYITFYDTKNKEYKLYICIFKKMAFIGMPTILKTSSIRDIVTSTFDNALFCENNVALKR